MFAGQLIAGAWRSCTVTVKLLVATRPEGSVAVAVTVVEPTAKVLPEAGLYTTVTEQLSEAMAANVTGALHWPVALPTTMFAGGTMVGFWLSLTVMRNEQVAVRPVGLVAVTTTVVMPGPKKLPEGRL